MNLLRVLHWFSPISVFSLSILNTPCPHWDNTPITILTQLTFTHFSDLSLYSSRKAALNSFKLGQLLHSPMELCISSIMVLVLGHSIIVFCLYSLFLPVGRSQNILYPHYPSLPICIPVHSTVSSRKCTKKCLIINNHLAIMWSAQKTWLCGASNYNTAKATVSQHLQNARVT